jgi:hypothetical protein
MHNALFKFFKKELKHDRRSDLAENPKSSLLAMPSLFLLNKLVWLVPLAQVLPRPQLNFPSKTWFYGNPNLTK